MYLIRFNIFINYRLPGCTSVNYINKQKNGKKLTLIYCLESPKRRLLVSNQHQVLSCNEIYRPSNSLQSFLFSVFYFNFLFDCIYLLCLRLLPYLFTLFGGPFKSIATHQPSVCSTLLNAREF